MIIHSGVLSIVHHNQLSKGVLGIVLYQYANYGREDMNYLTTNADNDYS